MTAGEARFLPYRGYLVFDDEEGKVVILFRGELVEVVDTWQEAYDHIDGWLDAP